MVATENTPDAAPGTEFLDDPLFIASELRAAGASWEASATELNLSARELRGLVHTEASRWRQLMRAADRAVLNEAGHEAHRVLRHMLRDQDP